LGTDTAYAELGLAPGATEAEVKAAWRRLASTWHPDRNANAGAVGRMQRINLAFEALRQAGFPGAAAPSAAAPAAPPRSAASPGQASSAPAPEAPDDDASDAPDAPDAPDASDAPDRQEPRRRTLSRKLKLTLEEAALGCTKVLRGRANPVCADCAGAGWRATQAACTACEGLGQVRQRTWFGLFGMAVDCSACAGSGIARQPCAPCQGSGRLEQPGYRVTVRLPAGVRHGDQLQVDGRRMRPDPSPGDLQIKIELLAHPFFVLDDDGTLRCELPVNGFAWMANRTVPLPTLDGLGSLALQRDQRDYRLAGQGFPMTRRGPRADLCVTIVPRFPERSSTDQEILLDQLLAASSGADPRLVDWQQRLRDWASERERSSA
jgi:molecular chaperone DnaJ